MVNTEHLIMNYISSFYYNILNIVVNTERELRLVFGLDYYNILNIVVNTEQLTYHNL